MPLSDDYCLGLDRLSLRLKDAADINKIMKVRIGKNKFRRTSDIRFKGRIDGRPLEPAAACAFFSRTTAT